MKRKMSLETSIDHGERGEKQILSKTHRGFSDFRRARRA
jgi:hypothetical protein